MISFSRYVEIRYQLTEDIGSVLKKYNIVKHVTKSTGLDPDKGIWYGWSHRAIMGFKIGDKLFDPEYGDENTKFSEHGSETIRTLEDAKLAAQRFADYVS